MLCLNEGISIKDSVQKVIPERKCIDHNKKKSEPTVAESGDVENAE